MEFLVGVASQKLAESVLKIRLYVLTCFSVFLEVFLEGVLTLFSKI